MHVVLFDPGGIVRGGGGGGGLGRRPRCLHQRFPLALPPRDSSNNVIISPRQINWGAV